MARCMYHATTMLGTLYIPLSRSLLPGSPGASNFRIRKTRVCFPRADLDDESNVGRNSDDDNDGVVARVARRQ